MNSNKKKYDGKIFQTKNNGKLEIVEYINAHNVIVRFLDTDYKFTARIETIKNGDVKDRLKPNVLGIGYSGVGKYSSKTHKKIYKTWRGMLERCYDDKYQAKQSTYIGTTVCEQWHNFQNFAKWHEENYIDDCDLDKDLLQYKVKNKIYSPNTCVFLPQIINNFMTNIQSNNTSGFTGVGWHKASNKWTAQIKSFNTNQSKHLGLFSDVKLAKQCYINARHEQSEKAKQYMRNLGYWKEEIIGLVR